ncbi:MAG: LCP family protein [Treponema sp.]|nr:LCP family protein [Treponema sp.]
MKFTREQKSLLLLISLIAVVALFSLNLFFALREDSVKTRMSNDEAIVRVLFVVNQEDSALCTEILMYNPENLKGAVLEVPGNTGGIYERTLGRVDRIDSIYRERGVDVYRTELENLIVRKDSSNRTKSIIPFRIEISLDSLCELCDVFGGFAIFIPFPIDIQDKNGERFLLPSGAVNLDGDKLREYFMYLQEDESEKDREERRHAAVSAFFTSLKENRSTFLNPQNFSRFMGYFRTDLDGDGNLELFSQISSLDPDKFIKNTVKGEYRDVFFEDLNETRRLLFPEDSGKLLKQVINTTGALLLLLEPPQEGRSYVLEVLNGTGQRLLAGRTAEKLKSAGYEVPHVADADRSDYEQTVIIDHIDNDDAAKVLCNFLHCSNVIKEELSSQTDDEQAPKKYDFTIILGMDF